MINVKEAVEIAFRFADEVLSQEKLIDPRLEEVEAPGAGECWYVTVSFLRQTAGFGEMLEPTGREYKVLTIRSEDGQVESMKIRQPL